MKTMNKILVLVGVTLLVFTVTMIVVYVRTGGIPDTLCTCVFSVCGTECGVMGWIRTNKDKLQDRKWDLQDRKEQRDND
jgi:hypothetical protein